MSKHETPISKLACRNIGGANTAINEKKGGGGFITEFQKLDYGHQKSENWFKIYFVGRSKVCVAKSVFSFYKKEDFKNLKLALWILQGLENKKLFYIFLQM